MQIDELNAFIITKDGFKIYISVENQYNYPNTNTKDKFNRILEAIKQDSADYFS